MKEHQKIIEVRFFQSDSGRMYVREWLVGLSSKEKKIIGEDLKTVEFGWPLGMPMVEKIEAGLWTVRSILPGPKYSRVFFTIYEEFMILLHGFIKKSNKIDLNDLKTARKRRKIFIAKEKK